VLACFTLDFGTSWIRADHELRYGERKQQKVIAMRSMTARWARPAVAGPLEVVYCLPKALSFCLLGGSLCKSRLS
jgi:hypothetical protein